MCFPASSAIECLFETDSWWISSEIPLFALAQPISWSFGESHYTFTLPRLVLLNALNPAVYESLLSLLDIDGEKRCL